MQSIIGFSKFKISSLITRHPIPNKQYTIFVVNAVVKSILIALGAAIGANARYWIGGWIATQTHHGHWGTWAVNVAGSALIGTVMGLALSEKLSLAWVLFLAVGLLGGFTTFSSFSYENIQLFNEGQISTAFIYIFMSVLVGLLTCWGALATVRALTGA